MKFVGVFAALSASLALVSAQNNSNETICDKYTTALLMNNTAENQLTVLTLIVNTALIGNYSNATGPAMNEVTGILNDGTYEGTEVSLLKYFNGTLKSSNKDGQAASVNFLDGGGADPLKENKASNNDSSNQHALVTHLYQLFGSLLGCSQQSENGPFKTYQGKTSMSEVHRFMNIDAAETGYFIQQVGLAATSFGVSEEDAMTVGNALNQTFGFRCSAPAPLVPGAANASQSTCLDTDCPILPNSNCEASGESYGNGTNGVDPERATNPGSDGSTGGGNGGSGSGSGSGSGGNGDSASALLINTVGALALVGAGAIALAL